MDDSNKLAEAAFEKAVALPAEERAATVEEICAGNKGVVRQVNELLRAHDEAGAFLEKGPFTPGRPPASGHRSTRNAGPIHGGQLFGEFEILEHVGQGGMGAVFKARQISLNRLVALKTMLPVLASDADYVARFHREAIAAASLNHPNLVRVHSAGETDGLHWFAMEFVEGESAHGRLMRKGRIDPLEAIAIALHVATALEYAWGKAQLIHRDIKPDNIFISSDGEVKLGDLGLAKRAGEKQSLTLTGSSLGTPHYVSPEQGEGKKDVDLRADIYSLGCTLFHLVGGQPPYSGETAMSVMLKHVTMPVPDLRSVWPACREELARVVMKMMQKQPAGRQQSYGEVMADLRRAHDAMTDATVPAVLAVTRQPKDRRLSGAGEGGRSGTAAAKSRRSLILAVVAVLGLLGAVLFLAFGKKQPQERVAATPTSPGSAAPPPRMSGEGAVKNGGEGAAATLPDATKDKPFVNTLGMKFVPVPGTNVLFCIWETRVRDYTEYAKAVTVDMSWTVPHVDMRRGSVHVDRGPDHPVCAVNWGDANGFCQWLTEKEIAAGKLPEGMRYRLPTDEEWSRAAGMPGESGSTPKERHENAAAGYPWGDEWPPKGQAGNYGDMTYHGKLPNVTEWIEGYTDGFPTTAAVGSFAPNQFGIYDLGGNVWEWCEDLFVPGGPYRVLRGASWSDNDYRTLRSSYRRASGPASRGNGDGFRCVLAIATATPPAAAAPVQPASSTTMAATRDKPFLNTLGMKFVPVPGVDVLFSIWETRVKDYAEFARVNKVDDSWTKQEMGGVPVGREPEHPVCSVNWEDAMAFCEWLTKKESADGKLPNGMKYRLPTDEEWSRAVGLANEEGATPGARNGKNYVHFPWGTDWPPKGMVGNYAGDKDGYATTAPVGSFPPNDFGIYDLGGNVWEWCEDWFTTEGSGRVLRGASWNMSTRADLMSSRRYHPPPGSHSPIYGFRCVVGAANR